MIEGVEIKELATHADERGFFREIIRESDGFFGHFGQWSHALMYPGSAKAWHHHREQTDWWYAIGSLKVALYDLRPDSPTKGELVELFLGDHIHCQRSSCSVRLLRHQPNGLFNVLRSKLKWGER